MGSYTLFYPTNLKEGCKYPVVGWGNGTSVMGSSIYAPFNKHAASWGMFVAAAHTPMAGTGAQIRAAIDGTLNGQYRAYMNGKAGTAGHSQGGGGAINAASHNSVVALVGVQSCTMAGGSGFQKAGHT